MSEPQTLLGLGVELTPGHGGAGSRQRGAVGSQEVLRSVGEQDVVLALPLSSRVTLAKFPSLSELQLSHQ